MRTACGSCGKEFSSPEVAERHFIRSHKPIARAVGGTINGRFVRKWPEDAPFLYRDGQRWGDYAGLTPQSTLTEGAKTGVDSAISTAGISSHVGADWTTTPCLCDCHYGKPECNEKACA